MQAQRVNQRVKCLHKHPVPTGEEVGALLDSLPDYHPHKLALGLIAVQGMRPIETTAVVYGGLACDSRRQRVIKMRHWVYKPKSYARVRSISEVWKEIEKPIYCSWLSRQLLGYAERTPPYPCVGARPLTFPAKSGFGYFADERDNYRMFGFTTTDVLSKLIRTRRLGDDARFRFLEDPCLYTIKGQDKTNHRVTLYSLRRFAFTFHYWVTFNRDAVALSYAMGHTQIRTTMEHYVFPKESIGLTQEMIDRRISIGEFIGQDEEGNHSLQEYSREVVRMIDDRRPQGQRTLGDFSFLGA